MFHSLSAPSIISNCDHAQPLHNCSQAGILLLQARLLAEAQETLSGDLIVMVEKQLIITFFPGKPGNRVTPFPPHSSRRHNRALLPPQRLTAPPPAPACGAFLLRRVRKQLSHLALITINAILKYANLSNVFAVNMNSPTLEKNNFFKSTLPF